MTSVNRVGFLIHPTSADFVRRTFPEAKTDADIDALLRSFAPALDYSINVTSLTGAKVEVFVYGVPLMPKDFVSRPRDEVMAHLLAAARLAKRDGVRVLGLAAFTSIVPSGGLQIERAVGIPCTSGNTFTAAIAVRGLLGMAADMKRDVRECIVAVVGATGSVGSPCVDLIAAHRPKKILLVARNTERLASRADQVRAEFGVDVEWSTDLEDLRSADLVFVSASATTALLEPHVLKSGALVCDVSVPHAVSQTIFEKRPDVLVMEGGVVRIDEKMMQSFTVKAFPSENGIQVSKLMPCSAYLADGLLAACLAETFLVGLEGKFENVGLGAITAKQALDMEAIGRKHGMVVARERLTLFAELLQDPGLAEAALRRFVASREVVGVVS
jgi:fatty aldehyde-generating acyl-ACP reductase